MRARLSLATGREGVIPRAQPRARLERSEGSGVRGVRRLALSSLLGTPSSRFPCPGRCLSPRPVADGDRLPGLHSCPARSGSRRLQLPAAPGPAVAPRPWGRQWIAIPATSSSGCSSNSAPWPCCSPKVGGCPSAGRGARGPRRPLCEPLKPVAWALLPAARLPPAPEPAGHKLLVLRSRGGDFAAHRGRCLGPGSRWGSQTAGQVAVRMFVKPLGSELKNVCGRGGERGGSVGSDVALLPIPGRGSPGGASGPQPQLRRARVCVSW